MKLSEKKKLKIGKLLLLVLTAAGIMLSGYLWMVHISGSDVVCTTSCDEVIQGEYGSLYGIPVGALGVAFYGLLSLLFIIQYKVKDSFVGQLIGGTLIGGTVFTLYLRYLEFFVIGAICSWCWGSVFILLLIVIVYLSLVKPNLQIKGDD